MNIVTWVKNNWLVVILVAVIVFLLLGNRSVGQIGRTMTSGSFVASDMAYGSPEKIGFVPDGIVRESAPAVADQRMVVQDTTLSMQVKDVSSSVKGIENIATDMGGYMVNRSLTRPEGAASGNITLRVPAEKREQSLNKIRELGVKVVSENVFGHDVTDQYIDIETRVANLEKVKAKMETILEQATQVQDLVQVQNQINNIQQQIDNLKGQQNYLEQTAKLTKITVYLSTDELALPYTPDDAWRPGVVFKTAVRSMIGALRGVANAVIWLVVYLPVILLIVILVYVAKRVRFKKFSV